MPLQVTTPNQEPGKKLSVKRTTTTHTQLKEAAPCAQRATTAQALLQKPSLSA